MLDSDLIFPLLGLPLFFAVLLGLAWLLRQRNAAVLARLVALAQSFGWSNVGTSSFLGLEVTGHWNGVEVSWRHTPRSKSRPQQLVTVIGRGVETRLLIRRRSLLDALGDLFGPSVVDLPYEQLIVRCNDESLARRLVTDEIAAALSSELLSPRDHIVLNERRLTITRAIDVAEVLRRLGRPGFDREHYAKNAETIARESWQVATMFFERMHA